VEDFTGKELQMKEIILGWSGVYAVGVAVYAIWMMKKYLLSNKK
jgi:hypothetical protein